MKKNDAVLSKGKVAGGMNASNTNMHKLMKMDHIIPLRGVWVSGLHVPENLRVIPAAENARKKNRFLPELLERHGR